MKIEVSHETLTQVRQVAKEQFNMMVKAFSYDGHSLKTMPSITLRDTIIGRMVSPDNLIRVQLCYPESGPDDRWYAACEALLGGGILHNGRKYKILGGSSSLKKGVVWCAVDEVCEQMHQYFSTSQEALSYLGVFFSGCHEGIHHLDGVQGRVVEDGEYDTADGMGFISTRLMDSLGLHQRQIQVRLISDGTDDKWLAKGTLLHADLPEGTDFILPASMIKGKGSPKDIPWTLWFGVRDIALVRSYSSSFSFAQWFDSNTLDAVWPVAEQRLEVIRGALADRDSAMRFLGLLKSSTKYVGGTRKSTDSTDKSDKSLSSVSSVSEDLAPPRSKAEAFLGAGIEPDHPWLQRQLVQLMRRSFVELALGGGIKLQGRMGAWADLPDSVICVCDLPAGPVVLSRYPVRDPHSIQAVWNEPDAVDGALPGTIYLNNNDALLLDGDYDGDYYVTCTQEAVVDAVSAPSWYPAYRRQDVPPKNRRKDPLTALPFVAVNSLGNRIGSITYAISAALHSQELVTTERDKHIAELSASLQAEVQSLKWDTRANRTLLRELDLKVPEYITDAKTDRDLFIRHAEDIEGDFPLIQNYNRVVKVWKYTLPPVKPLSHFKHFVPIWKVPEALECVEEATAVVQTYNRWITRILDQVKEPTMDDLAGPIGFLEAWDRSKVEDRKAFAVALWHVLHGTRADSTGSAAFHAFTDELVAMVAGVAGHLLPLMPEVSAGRQGMKNTESHSRGLESWPNGEPVVLPVVGAIAGKDSRDTMIQILHNNVTREYATITTAEDEKYGVGFFANGTYPGSIPKDHLLYGSIPALLCFKAQIT
ncbi:hypothetical protein K8I28_11640, partial [bacterium]|nr:hypothetical protein [bacterium]